MTSVTINEIPELLHAQLKREAEANFRTVSQEVLARIERTFELDAVLNTKRDQKWIEEALASGPATPLREEEMDAPLAYVLRR